MQGFFLSGSNGCRSRFIVFIFCLFVFAVFGFNGVSWVCRVHTLQIFYILLLREHLTLAASKQVYPCVVTGLPLNRRWYQSCRAGLSTAHWGLLLWLICARKIHFIFVCANSFIMNERLRVQINLAHVTALTDQAAVHLAMGCLQLRKVLLSISRALSVNFTQYWSDVHIIFYGLDWSWWFPLDLVKKNYFIDAYEFVII